MIGGCFCTIITLSHLAYAKTLFDSISKFDASFELNVLIVDVAEEIKNLEVSKGINLFGKDQLKDTTFAVDIQRKYFRKDLTDQYRWSMKPVFMSYLLLSGIEKVVYVDSDVCFFGDPSFLFEELSTHKVLLTPHWESFDQHKNENGFVRNIKNGFFNGGFVGANKDAIGVLRWWSEMCLFACSKESVHGIYDDQGYLNLLPVYFDGVKIVNHKGCNVADWNIEENEREIVGGKVLVGGFEIVFIHFANDTIKDILDGEDGLLLPYFLEYEQMLMNHSVNRDIRAVG